MHNLPGHVTLWVLSAVLALLFLRRAWTVGRDGLDADGNIRDVPQLETTRLWAALGIGLLAISLIDAFYLFNPPPPPMR